MDAADFINSDGEADFDVLDNKNQQKWFEELNNVNEEESTVSTTEGIKSMEPRVVNIIAVAQFNAEFKLYEIATNINGSEYNPKRIHAVTIRIKEPKATGLVFKTGKVSIVGCNSIEDANKAAKKFRRILSRIDGYQGITRIDFTISSIVATINCQFNIRIEELANSEGHNKFCQYNPDKFAGVVYRIPDPKVTLMIFMSGSIVMTGAKKLEDLSAAAEWVYPILKMFRA